MDISVLNDASPIFTRQALEKGIELFCGNERKKYEFVIKVLYEYDDLKYFRRHIKKIFWKGVFLPDKDIIYEKAGNIQRCLNRIREATDLKNESLDNIDIQDRFVLNL